MRSIYVKRKAYGWLFPHSTLYQCTLCVCVRKCVPVPSLHFDVRHCLHCTQVNRPIGHHTDVKMHKIRCEQTDYNTTNGNIFYLNDMFCLLTASTIYYSMCSISHSIIWLLGLLSFSFAQQTTFSSFVVFFSLPFSVTMTFAGRSVCVRCICHSVNMLYGFASFRIGIKIIFFLSSSLHPFFMEVGFFLFFFVVFFHLLLHAYRAGCCGNSFCLDCQFLLNSLAAFLARFVVYHTHDVRERLLSILNGNTGQHTIYSMYVWFILKAIVYI